MCGERMGRNPETTVAVSTVLVVSQPSIVSHVRYKVLILTYVGSKERGFYWNCLSNFLDVEHVFSNETAC